MACEEGSGQFRLPRALTFRLFRVSCGAHVRLVPRVLGHADRKSTGPYTNRATAALVTVLRP